MFLDITLKNNHGSDALDQGDQRSLWKYRQKCSPTHFLQKLISFFYPGKNIPIFVVISVFFIQNRPKKQPPHRLKCDQYAKNRPIGENRPIERKFVNSGHPALM
jgi:hypothetical protein